jgi:hypothetical protein
MGANKIQWTNNVTLDKDNMSFCPKIKLSYQWIKKSNLIASICILKNQLTCIFNMWFFNMIIIKSKKCSY